jgi:hypothetical protein
MEAGIQKRRAELKGTNSSAMKKLIADLQAARGTGVTKEQKAEIDRMIERAKKEFYNDWIGGDPVDDPEGLEGEVHLVNDLTNLGINQPLLNAVNNKYDDDGK